MGTNMRQNAVVIVDGYSTGRFFAPKLRARGYACIHVQSTNKIPACYEKDFCQCDYIENFIAAQEFAANILARSLHTYNILAVIPGSEMGVELADQICDALGLDGNEITLSEARRDKGKMITAVEKGGLKTPRFLIANDVAEIFDWIKQENKWPIVVKPLRSGGADGVSICNSNEEVVRGLEKVVQSRTVFDENNVRVLIESYLEGVQYMINTVSMCGKHYLSDAWICSTPPIVNDLLPGDFAQKELILPYVFAVLDALGVKFGASHVEIMLTKEGPVLIEMGARVMGVFNPDFIQNAIGQNQVDLLLDSYIDQDAFLKSVARPYFLHKYARHKFIESFLSGRIAKINDLKSILSLPSFCGVRFKVKENDLLHKTVDGASSPGVIAFAHADKMQLENDFQKFLEFEPNLFFLHDE